MITTEEDIERERATNMLVRKVEDEVEDALRACVRDWNMSLADLSLEHEGARPLRTRIMKRGKPVCVVEGSLSPDAKRYSITRFMLPH